MLIITIAFVLALVLVCAIHSHSIKKNRLNVLSYSVSFSSDEIFEGEYFYLVQTLTNTGLSAIRFLKTEAMLPEGLRFVLPNQKSLSSSKDDLRQSVQSVFSVPAGSAVTRRWRVTAIERGVYRTGDISMLAIGNDVLGLSAFSVTMKPEEGKEDTIVVLPCAKERIEDIALNAAYAGVRSAPRGLLPDPMSVCGVRKYHPDDPMNRIDWKQTARMGELMVREQEYQIRDSFNVLLNMQSLRIEKHLPKISAPSYIEDAIEVCASLLDSAISNDSPVFLVANAPPSREDAAMGVGDDVGPRIFCSDEYRRHDEVMRAYRMLAFLPMEISVPFEKVLDDVVTRPEVYARGGHLVVVSCYLDERMLRFHRVMEKKGYRVIFFILSTGQNPMEIPEDMDVYFRPCTLGKRGEIYAS